MMKPKFTQSDVSKMFAKRVQAIEKVMIRQLQILGEKCVNLARTLDTYRDQTGNLRGSIGYVIYAGNKPGGYNFEGVGEGAQAGLAIAQKHAAKYTNQYFVLVIVAGMNYAEAVESLGYDVLTPAEHLAEREWPKLKGKVIEMIGRAA